MTWSLQRILRASGGELLQWGAGPFHAVSTDSRRTREGDVFLALVGPNFDGHDFVAPALAGGASGVVVERAEPPSVDGVAWVRVGDTLHALGDLAAAWRRALPTRIVAVTGSNGKTTTKEMIASIVEASGARFAKSIGTENNLVGVPHTILRLSGEEQYAVLEMGMNHAGEIWRLAEIARPDVGVITNIGPAHLEGLGSLAGVAGAKSELVLALSSSATLVVNADDSRLTRIAETFAGRKLLAGASGPVRAVSVEPHPDGQRVTIEIETRSFDIRLRCLGSHNVTNAVLAATAGVALGISADAIAGGLERFSPPPMRLESTRLRNGARVWNDAYNANPASMAAALAALAAEPAKRRVAVLGEMWELGAEAPRYHREVGRRAAQSVMDLFFAVGRFAETMAAGAIEGGLPQSRVFRCGSPEEAARQLRDELRDGDLVLVKGSRGARMEEVLRGLGE